jgi:type I restriction enzyme S subunit
MNSWRSLKLPDCIDKSPKFSKIQKKGFLPRGKFPVVSQESGLINGYWDDKKDVVKVDQPLVVFGDHTKILKLIDFDFVVGADGVKLLKPKSFLNAKYFYYYLLGHPVKGLGYARHFRLLKELEVRFPPLPEQKRIVAILDEAFEGIAKVVANTEKNLVNARELFESYLNFVFKKKGGIWDQKKLGDVCENLDSKRVPITKSKRKAGEVPYYGASGIVDYVADYLFDEDLLLVSEDGANLLARTYPIAFSISGKSWVNNHAHVLRFEDFASQKFVEYYLNSISLAPYVSGMAQPKLNQKALNSIPVPFPEINILTWTVERLDALSGHVNELDSIYQQKLTALAELKQSLLQKAFTGELTARDKNKPKEAAA